MVVAGVVMRRDSLEKKKKKGIIFFGENFSKNGVFSVCVGARSSRGIILCFGAHYDHDVQKIGILCSST